MYELDLTQLNASKKKPTGAAYAQAREQEKQRKKAIREQRRAAAEATREEDAELAAQMKASARLNGEVGRFVLGSQGLRVLCRSLAGAVRWE